MTVAENIQSDSPSTSNVSDFTITLKRLLELLELEEEDEYGILKPTQYAFKTAMQLVVESYEIVGSSFPRASASTDEKGGIRLAWQNTERDCRVRLFCPSTSEEKGYIYHQKGEEYGSEDGISAPALVQWMEWLKQA